MPTYQNIPSVEQFQKDTGRTKHDVLKFLNRSDDPLMRSIDKLLEKWDFHATGRLPLSQPQVFYVLTQLYFGTQKLAQSPVQVVAPEGTAAGG